MLQPGCWHKWVIGTISLQFWFTSHNSQSGSKHNSSCWCWLLKPYVLWDQHTKRTIYSFMNVPTTAVSFWALLWVSSPSEIGLPWQFIRSAGGSWHHSRRLEVTSCIFTYSKKTEVHGHDLMTEQLLPAWWCHVGRGSHSVQGGKILWFGFKPFDFQPESVCLKTRIGWQHVRDGTSDFMWSGLKTCVGGGISPLPANLGKEPSKWGIPHTQWRAGNHILRSSRW